MSVLACSGTGAVEAALVNMFATGDRVVVLASGKFGARWADVAECFGMHVKSVPIAPGETFGEAEMAAVIAAFQPVQGVVITASETSTGAALDVRALAQAARSVEPDVAVVVDAITAIGAVPVETDEWDLDAVCGGSQKAFMIPPGLAFVACSPRGWERVREDRNKPRYYFDLRKYGDRASDDQTPFTPATSLILEMEAALLAIQDAGGIGALEANAQQLAHATREAARALNLDLLSPVAPSAAVTAIKIPGGRAPEVVYTPITASPKAAMCTFAHTTCNAGRASQRRRAPRPMALEHPEDGSAPSSQLPSSGRIVKRHSDPRRSPTSPIRGAQLPARPCAAEKCLRSAHPWPADVAQRTAARARRPGHPIGEHRPRAGRASGRRRRRDRPGCR